IGPMKECLTAIPAIYATVSDWIESSGTFSLYNQTERETALNFTKYAENRVDAHVDNFTFEKSTGKVVLIDTEHFPTMIGLKEQFECKDYTSWYAKLSLKFLKNNYLQDKNTRRELQTKILPERYPV
ncbi:hypothetical protein H0X06_03620, partial [Candidatus Dependentiae bacterium]|nr:hypothetical protein [Candidatus Dependentiae bacterium]